MRGALLAMLIAPVTPVTLTTLMVLVTAAALSGCVAAPPARPATYVVQPGDTLYSIAWRFDLAFQDLAVWNDLGASYRLTPGQMLWLRPSVPARALPSTPAPAPMAATPPAAAPGGATSRATTAGAAATAGAPPERTEPAQVGKPQPLIWVWPTKSSRRPLPVPGGGVLLLGKSGQDVLAAAAGRVVYVGLGVRSYGNLVIIKHSDTLLSAYAHNREVSVRENQQVRTGERIGAMGLGPRQVPALYFEIRLNGKPVDVGGYLR